MPSREHSMLRRARRSLAAGLSVALTTGALVVAASSAAQAADPFNDGLYGVTEGNSAVFSIDRTTGAATEVVRPPTSVAAANINPNQLGISPDGQTLVYTTSTRVFTYSTVTEQWRSVDRPTSGTVANQMGGFDPNDRLHYYGGRIAPTQQTPNPTTFTFRSYDPVANSLSQRTITVTAPGAPGGNGDLAFDRLGNMYFVSGADLNAEGQASAQVYRVNAADLAAGSGTAAPVGGPISGDVRITSIAVGNDGFLYIGGDRSGGGSAVQQVNPITGATGTLRPVQDRRLLDLGSRALPATGQVTAPVVGDRVNPTDEFTATIGGNGITGPGNSASTGGNGPSTVGPLLIVPSDQPYTVVQTPKDGSGTDLADYDTTYRCEDLGQPVGADGRIVSSGDGNNASFLVGAARPDVSCTFTNTPKVETAAPTAPAATSNDNTLRSPVTVPVAPTGDGVTGGSVRIVDATGQDGRERVVEGQGTWRVNPENGAITFTPNQGYTGNPTPISYQVTDTQGRTATGTVTVRYTPEAQADESLRNPQGTTVTIPVLTNDRGVTDPASVRIVDAPGDGRELVVAGEGTWRVNPANGAISFEPLATFSGSPTPIAYTVRGPEGTATTRASVTVTYAPGAATDESLRNEQGTDVVVDVLDNDRGDLVATSVVIVDAPGDGKELVVEGEGTWTVNPTTGAITFSPEDGFSGNPTPITYRVTDERGETSTATVTVTYAPRGVADVSSGNQLGSPVTVPVLRNDLGDLDPTSIRIEGATGQDGRERVVDGQGTWTANPITGGITFTPNQGYTGNPTPVTYVVDDRRGETTQATVTVTFAPAAVDDASRDNVQGATVRVPVLENDRGSVDPTSVVIVGAPDGGRQLVVDGEGTWTVDPDSGAITFAPEEGFSGNPAPITYRVSGTGAESGLTTTATVTVTYVPQARADESLRNEQGADVTVPVLGNDLGELDPTSVVIVGAPDGGKELVAPGEGTWMVNPETGAVTFSPQDGFSGNPSPITYRVTDAEGRTSTAPVTVTYLPQARDDESLRNAQGTDVTVPVLGNDLGELDATSVVIVDAPGDGKELVVEGEGTWTVNPTTGAITFAPEEGFSGNPSPITYRVTDERDETSTAEVVVTYVPQARDDASRGNAQGTDVTVPVLGNDLGELDATSVVIVDAPGNGRELVVEGEGTWTVNPTTGAITFSQEDGFSGNPTPITYQVTDTEGETSRADVVVTYGPEAVDDASRGNAQGTDVTVPVLGNDLGELDPTSVVIVDAPGDGKQLVVEGEGTWTVVTDPGAPNTGAITFAPEDGFSGNPTPITYEVTDSEGETSQADVVVTYGPVAVDDESLRNTQGADVPVDVLDNDLGDLDPTSVVIEGAQGLGKQLVVEGEGTWTVNPTTGVITFAPEEGFSGNPTPITYEVTDAEGEVTEADVTVTYLPQARDDESLRNEQGTDVGVDVLENDLGDLDPTSVVIVGAEGEGKELVVEGEGTWTVDPETGAITFAPEDGFSGNPTPITYQVIDTEGETSEANVVVTYLPQARDDESLDNEAGTSVTIDPLANDLGDLDPTSVVIVDAPGDGKELVVEGEGTWTVDPTTGAITFTPEDGFEGDPTPITYEVTDENGETTEATLTITYRVIDDGGAGGDDEGDGAGDGADDGRGGLLPDAGGPATLWLLLAGLAAVVTGGALTVRRRERA